MKAIPDHWSYVLQGVAHWIAYKKEYYFGHLLTEGAIVSEITQFLAAKLKGSQIVCCEVMYNKLDTSIVDSTRADIVIYSHKDTLTSENVLEVIEVKRLEKNHEFNKVIEDFEKLARLKNSCANARLFQVVVGQKKLIKTLLNKNHNLYRSNIYTGQQNLKAFPRLAKKAYGSKVQSEVGVFAVIVEII
jgi:hypothetical protein